MNLMAATLSSISVDAFALVSPVPAAYPDRPRHITFSAGRALEMLGHAIEYLSDEYFCDESSVLDRAHLEAVQILMSLNHDVYFACPPVMTLRERWHSILHPHRV
jgi:hypothetical protein